MIKNIKKKKLSKTKKYSNFYETSFGKRILEKELMILNRELLKCKSVLSIGCGTAVHESQLVKQNPNLELTCLDMSKYMLRESQELSHGLNLLQGSAEQLPVKDEIFDCVYFITSFEFIQDYDNVLTETSRVLEPLGKALFLIFNFRSWYFQKEYSEAGSYIKSNIKHLDNEKLQKAISAQFEIISTSLELAIKGDEVFETDDPKWASLYVITAHRKEVVD